MRLTDGPTMDVVEMVLGGKVNKGIVAQINQQGGRAVGLSGKDGGLIEARKMHIVHQADGDSPPEIIDPGMVGEVTRINPELSTPFPGRDSYPSSPRWALGLEGETYNINADLVASHIAVALSAGRLMLLTDVDGVMDAEGRLISSIDAATIRRMIADGSISGGMIPKIEYAVARHKNGVEKVPILNGKRRHAILAGIVYGSGDWDGSNRISVHSERASCGPARRSHLVGILDVAPLRLRSNKAAALIRTAIYPF
jgi:acetylglutamate kinase